MRAALVLFATAESLVPVCVVPKKTMKVAQTVVAPVGLFYGIMCLPLYGKGLVPGSGGFVDFDVLEPRSSPNEFLAAPSGRCESFGDDKRIEAPVYPLPVDDLQKAFQSMLRKRYTIERFADPTLVDGIKKQYVFVERTPLLRFPDIINVQFLPVDDQTSTLLLHSASVFGYSDLGKNKARVSEMLTDLQNLPGYLKRRTVPV